GMIAHPTSINVQLPTALGDFVAFGHGRHVDSDHRFAEIAADLEENFRVVEMRHSFDNRFGAFGRVAALKYAGADENAVHAKLHHQCCVSRSRDTARCKMDHWKASEFGGFLNQRV